MKKFSVIRPSGAVKYGFTSEGAAAKWIRKMAKGQGLVVNEIVDDASTPFLDYMLSNDDVYSIHIYNRG